MSPNGITPCRRIQGQHPNRFKHSVIYSTHHQLHPQLHRHQQLITAALIRNRFYPPNIFYPQIEMPQESTQLPPFFSNPAPSQHFRPSPSSSSSPSEHFLQKRVERLKVIVDDLQQPLQEFQMSFKYPQPQGKHHHLHPLMELDETIATSITTTPTSINQIYRDSVMISDSSRPCQQLTMFSAKPPYFQYPMPLHLPQQR
ncbi:uncharacterized protein [Musca autumnalis]|uniref:uncharacterized protein n=1 Tax=Musca autumnalis TaxID=221902 RepID=UPI003CF5CA07